MRFQPKLFFLVFPVLLVWTASDRADQVSPQISGIKMIVRSTFDGMSGERTIYVRGDRKRLEYRNANGGAKRADGSVDMRYGPHIASITRCDLGKGYELNLDAREYHTAPYPPQWHTKEQRAAQGIQPQANLPTTPTVLIKINTRDTGERKEMFGHTARHVITTRKETPLEGSQSQAKESVTDGWYIDLDTGISCEPKWSEGNRAGHAYVVAQLRNANAPPEIPKFVAVGKPETGFAVEMKVTSRGTFVMPDGTKKENNWTSETTVTNLEEGPLDAAIFEVPAGFREVARIETNPPEDWQTALSSAWVRFKARVERVFD